MRLLASTIQARDAQREEFGRLNYNHNHYNLLFSHIVIIVIISDEDMLYYIMYADQTSEIIFMYRSRPFYFKLGQFLQLA